MSKRGTFYGLYGADYADRLHGTGTINEDDHYPYPMSLAGVPQISAYRGAIQAPIGADPYYLHSYGYNNDPYAYYDFHPVRYYGSYMQPKDVPYTYAWGEFPEPGVKEKPWHAAPTLGAFDKDVYVPVTVALAEGKAPSDASVLSMTGNGTDSKLVYSIAGVVTLVLLLALLFALTR